LSTARADGWPGSICFVRTGVPREDHVLRFMAECLPIFKQANDGRRAVKKAADLFMAWIDLIVAI
jgi:hypothetical protein